MKIVQDRFVTGFSVRLTLALNRSRISFHITSILSVLALQFLFPMIFGMVLCIVHVNDSTSKCCWFKSMIFYRYCLKRNLGIICFVCVVAAFFWSVISLWYQCLFMSPEWIVLDPLYLGALQCCPRCPSQFLSTSDISFYSFRITMKTCDLSPHRLFKRFLNSSALSTISSDF